MTEEQKELWMDINDDIEFLYMNLRGLNMEQLIVLNRLMANRNSLYGLVENEKIEQ